MTASARRWILAALFTSGLAGLAHEIAWARLLSNLIGSTATAQAVVLSVFMGGLAAGAVIFGRRSDRGGDPLATYVRLEIGIAIYCALLPLIVRGAGAGYEAVAAQGIASGGLKVAARVALAVIAVLAPALMMGGTLPIAARALIQSVGETRREVASVYAWNNIGAVLGGGLTGFWILPALGIQGSLLCASTANLAAAALAANARKSLRAIEPVLDAAPRSVEPIYSTAVFRATLVALFLSGFAALGYEVLFVRSIALGLGSSTYSFTLMLMGFIAGIGVGSFVLAGRRVERPLWWLGASQLGVVGSLALVLPAIERLPYWSGLLRVALQQPEAGFTWYLTGQGLLVLAILLLPTVCLGFGFPLVAQVQARSPATIGASVGSTYAWNTIGNVFGVVATSLWILPALGLARSFALLLAVHCAGGLLIVVLARESKLAWRAAAGAAAVALVAWACTGGGAWARTLNFAANHLRLREGPAADATTWQKEHDPTASWTAWKTRYVYDPAAWQDVFLSEDADATVLALRKDKDALLCVNGKGDASTGPFDMITQVLLGQLPMFLLPKAQDVLVIGWGSGVTCGSLLRHGIRRLDMVEICAGVLGADRLFARFNHDALADPRVHVFREDARTFLRTEPEKYDLIISQPSNPWIAGIGGLFTEEFFRDASVRLNPGGALCVWFHHYEQSDETVELVLRTLNAVFPNVEVFFSSNLSDVIALASPAPLEPDFAAMEARFDEPGVRADLARVSVYDLANLLGYHAVSRARFPASFGPGPRNTDDHQRLEYLGAKNLFLGRDSELLVRFDGFGPAKDGGSDWLLDRYLAWRAAAGDPAGKDELGTAARSAAAILGADHRLWGLMNQRATAAPAKPPTAGRPSRGATPDIATVEFAEAFNRGLSRQAAGAVDEAIVLWQRALAVEPGHPLPTQALCQVYSSRGQVEPALALAAESVRLRPNDIELALYQARLANDLGRADESKRLYEALSVRAPSAEAFSMLGAFAYAAGDVAGAIALNEQALRVDPTAWQPAAALVSVLRDTQDPANLRRAGKVLWDALQMHPDNPQLLQLHEELAPGQPFRP